MNKLKELDPIALLKSFPEKRLFKGQVGTIVEKLDPKTFEVEFTDKKGTTLAIIPVKESDLMLLHFSPVLK